MTVRLGSINKHKCLFLSPTVLQRVGGIPRLFNAVRGRNEVDLLRARFQAKSGCISDVIIPWLVSIGPEGYRTVFEWRPVGFTGSLAAVGTCGYCVIWQQLCGGVGRLFTFTDDHRGVGTFKKLVKAVYGERGWITLPAPFSVPRTVLAEGKGTELLVAVRRAALLVETTNQE